MRALNAFVFNVLLTLMMGCSDGTSTQLPKQTSEGVILYGCNGSDGLLENTNPYPVRVRRVWQGSYGEKTESIDMLAPGAKLSRNEVRPSQGFYIYTMDGAMVGWIKGVCPRVK